MDIDGKCFCLTGIPKSERALCWALIVKAGGRWVNALSGAVDYMVVGETPGPSKLKKAEAWGLPVVSQAELEAALRAELGIEGSLMAVAWKLPIKEDKKQAAARRRAENAERILFEGRSFCITGETAAERMDYWQALEDVGAEVRTTVSKTLDDLVAGVEPGPTKMSLAKQYEVRVLGEAEFYLALCEKLGLEVDAEIVADIGEASAE
jgi:NAD-dependent DNA ligase